MVIYNVHNNGACNQLVIELINDSVYIDADSVAYISGNINVDAEEDSIGRKIKSYFIGTNMLKPKFHGTGKIYLYATLGTYHKFSIKNGEELFLNPRIFMVCRDSLELSAQIDISPKNFFTGAPMLKMRITGHGSVMVLMPGPIQECVLNDDKFVAIGPEIAAYSPSLKLTREIIGKTWLIAPKMARVFRGKGSIFFSPIPNKDSKSRINKNKL